MNDADRDVREALDRLARPAPPPLDTLGVLAVGRRARRRRSLLTAGGAVAGLVVVVAGAGLLRAGLPDPGTGGLTPAASSPASATSAPAAGIGWQQPPVPGLSTDEARRIARGCAESFGGSGGRIGTGASAPDPSAAPRPQATLVDDPTAPLLADVVQLFNLVRDDAGTLALVYGPGVTLDCKVGDPGLPYNAGGALGDEHQTAWMPGPVSIDVRESAPGGDSGGKYPGTRGYDMVAGRVLSSVAKVTVTFGSDTATVPVVNGTYLVRFVHGSGAPLPDGNRGLTVRAYDARHELVGETGGTSLADCYITPDGTKISGDRTDPGQPCKPAVRWR